MSKQHTPPWEKFNMLALISDKSWIFGSVLSLFSENRLFSCHLLVVSKPQMQKSMEDHKDPICSVPLCCAMAYGSLVHVYFLVVLSKSVAILIHIKGTNTF